MRLTDEELINTKGGAKGLVSAIIFGIASVVTLIIGIVDGYLNPTKCNN